MRWFSHRRSRTRDERCTGRRRRAWLPKEVPHFSIFCSWWPWPLTLTFKLGRDFCTVHAPIKAKFHDPMFNRSEVIVQTNRQTHKQIDTVRSMRWFSNRRSPSPPSGHAMVSSVAACCIRPSYGARPTIHCQWGWLSSFSFFLPVDLDLWPWLSNSGEIFVQRT